MFYKDYLNKLTAFFPSININLSIIKFIIFKQKCKISQKKNTTSNKVRGNKQKREQALEYKNKKVKH